MTLEEFKNIAPKLTKLQKIGSGLSVPKDYFGTVEDAVFLKFTEDKLDNKSPFKIPENYFETLEDKVFERLQTETKVIDFKTRFVKTFLPIATAASLLLFVTLQLLNNSTDNKDLFAKMELSEIEGLVESLIENNDFEMNSYQIAALYEDTDFEDFELNQQYSDDNLMEYLNDIDVESLILTN